MENQEAFTKADNAAFAKFERQFKHYWPSECKLKKMEDGCLYDAEIITPEGLKYMVEIKTRPNQTWTGLMEKYGEKYGPTILFNVGKYMRLRHIKGDWNGRFIAYMFDDYWMWFDLFNLRIENIININPQQYIKEVCDESNFCIWVDNIFEVK